MKLNTKIRYGLRTMIEIAMNAGSNGLFQKDIAKSQDIPLKYLDKIVAALKSAELIINVSGKRSGYILSKPARQINVYDIYKAFEGKLSIVQCMNEQGQCCKDEACASQEYWMSLNKSIKVSMSSTTLDDLAQRQNEFNREKNEIINFQI